MLDLKELIRKLIEPKTITPSISASTGTLVAASGVQRGGMVMLSMTVKNSSTIANGGNLFTGTLSNYKPLANVMGAGYSGGIHFDLYITSAGAITVRNSGHSSLGANNNVVAVVTYIVGGST